MYSITKLSEEIHNTGAINGQPFSDTLGVNVASKTCNFLCRIITCHVTLFNELIMQKLEFLRGKEDYINIIYHYLNDITTNV